MEATSSQRADGFQKTWLQGSHPSYRKLTFNQETQRPKSWHLLVRGTQALGQGQLRSHVLWELPSCLWTHPALGSSVAAVMWHRAMSLVSPWECHLQISQWINHQLNVHSRDLPHTAISEAKDAAFFFTIRKLPCLLRPTKIFTGKSQQSHTARSILFSIFTTDLYLQIFLFMQWRYLLEIGVSLTSRCK